MSAMATADLDRLPRHFDWPPSRRDALVSQLTGALRLDPHVQAAWLYGSFCRVGCFRDIDVGLLLREPWALRDVGAISTRLWLAAGRPEPDLDVVPLNSAPPAFRINVARTGRVLAECWPGAAAEALAQAWRERFDGDASRASVGGLP